MPSAPNPSRLAYIDWMRGLACILMFQTHCYDAWLDEPSRNKTLFVWSQLGGTFPAPLFLFLAGMSLSLVVEKSWQKGLPRARIALDTIRRGAEVFAIAILFRLQEFVIALGWAPWTDLFRVDILNQIGLSMMMMGVLCSIFYRGPGHQLRIAAIAAAIALAVSLLSPPLWTSWQPLSLPWPIQSYINGVHNPGNPQPGMFPIFPWSAFAFLGLSVGFLSQTGPAQKLRSRFFVLAIAAGIALIYLGRWIAAQPWRLYATDDFWHTSPAFFVIRAGFMLLILGAAYSWCRWGLALRGFSPLIQLGRTSLLVYWVHLEFVYGRFSILHRRAMNIKDASLGLLIISLAMLALSILRTTLKKPQVHTNQLPHPAQPK